MDSAMKDRLARALLLTFAMVPIVISSMRPATVADPDIWWHLQTGNWILLHRSIPTQDCLSTSMSGKPWIAYSWGFETIIALCQHKYGLPGIIGLTGILVMASFISLFVLLRRYLPEHLAIGLSIIAAMALFRVFTPRPWLFTILLFTIELNILLHARETGRTGRMWLIPLLFIVWANTHIQFIYGLLVLGMVVAESFLELWLRRQVSYSRISALQSCSVLFASLMATLLNPHGWRVYTIIHQYTSLHALKYISEIQAMTFRDQADWLMLVLVSVAAFVLGKSGTKDLFLFALGAIACYVTFHSVRDIWFAGIVSVTIIAIHCGIKNSYQRPPIPNWTIGMAALIVFALSPLFTKWTSKELVQQAVAKKFPDKAVQYASDHHLPNPLYNSFNWGGYLLWTMPQMPVVIDSRANVYGNERVERSVFTWSGSNDWRRDPDLVAANTVILERECTLSHILQADPHFKVAYEDKLALVFQRVSKSDTKDDLRGSLE